jgi:transposase
MKEISTIGIDIAKNNFRLVGMNAVGKVVVRKWLKRDEVLEFMSNQKPSLVGMEACAGANYWAREFQKIGHVVKLMPPQYVKPYVKTNKNDTNDAEACAEAVTRPTMRFAAVKSESQQVLAQLHRARERLVCQRTALGNEIRGFLGEFGIVVPKGMDKLRGRVFEMLERHKERIATATAEMIIHLCAELKRFDEEIEFYEAKIVGAHEVLPESQRLDTIPGIGKITATAIVATFSGIDQFKNGRHFAAFLGLVPGQHSTGGKSRLGGISKRGDVYIRKLLVQGAQSVLKYAKGKDDRYSVWVQTLCDRRGWCRAAVAVANKNARIAWAVLARGEEFNSAHVPQRKVVLSA